VSQHDYSARDFDEGFYSSASLSPENQRTGTTIERHPSMNVDHVLSPLVSNTGRNQLQRHHYGDGHQRGMHVIASGRKNTRRRRKRTGKRKQIPETSTNPSAPPIKENALGQIRFGYQNLMKRIEEANTRRIACKNGSSMFMSFKEKSEKHRNGLQSQLEKVMDSPLMKTDLSEIAFQSEKGKVERDLQHKEQIHAENVEEHRRRQSMQEMSEVGEHSAMLLHQHRRDIQTAPAGGIRMPLPVRAPTKEPLTPQPQNRPSLKRMTTHPDLLPKHDEGTPTSSAVTRAIFWKQSEMSKRRRSSVQQPDTARSYPLTPQAPRSPPAPKSLPSSTENTPLSPRDSSHSSRQSPATPQSELSARRRLTSQGSKRRITVGDGSSPGGAPSSLQHKRKRETKRTCEELMRISPLLALTKAIETTEVQSSNYIRLPKVNLHQLNRSKLAISFTEKEAREKMESLIKDRNLSMAQKKQKLKELQDFLKSPMSRRRSSASDTTQPFSLVDTHSRFSNFLTLLKGEKKDMDKSLLNELQHKDMMRPKQYVQQCLNLSTKSVTWNQMVKEMHRQVNHQVHRSRNDERRKAKKMWFNNFVTKIHDPRKRSLSAPAKHILTVFQDFIDSDLEANSENFLKILDTFPEYHLCRMDVQNIVSAISRGFNMPEKQFLLYLHQRNIPFEFATPEEDSKKSYILDSAKVNYNAIFSEKDEPALSFEYPPKEIRNMHEVGAVGGGSAESEEDDEGIDTLVSSARSTFRNDDDESEESSMKFDDE